MNNIVTINRKKCSSEKLTDLEWANIVQQDWRSLMIRTLNLSRVRLDMIADLRNCHCPGGIKFEDDLDSQHVINLLNRPGLIALDAGIACYLYNNPDYIPQDWEGRTILFPGTIFCHKPYGRFWEPFCLLSMYQTNCDNGSKKWIYTYNTLHILSEDQLFAYLAEEDRDGADIITTSFINDIDPE